jgi:hypothetical protein
MSSADDEIFFHLLDNSNLCGLGEPGYDPRAKIQPLFDHVNRVCSHHCIPQQQQSTDESTV